MFYGNNECFTWTFSFACYSRFFTHIWRAVEHIGQPQSRPLSVTPSGVDMVRTSDFAHSFTVGKRHLKKSIDKLCIGERRENLDNFVGGNIEGM